MLADELAGLARLFSERIQLCPMNASYFVKIKKALQVSLLHTTLTELNPAQLGIGRPPEALSGLILGQATCSRSRRSSAASRRRRARFGWPRAGTHGSLTNKHSRTPHL